ncbi:MAG: translation elongation factor-like protein [Patescibacteria group bacterium]|nr:translation elongation factor-like protein [Patescibacteria group bacterium]
MGLFSSSKSKEPKPIGVVTHYYGGLGVAIVKFNKTIKPGERIHFKGATTDFEETIQSIQYDHKDVELAKKNQEVGIKVNDKVRDGDKVYAVE